MNINNLLKGSEPDLVVIDTIKTIPDIFQGGGIPYGTSRVSGPTGIGKIFLALNFVVAGFAQKEGPGRFRVLREEPFVTISIVGDVLDSDRWLSFLESTAAGLQLQIYIVSPDDNSTLTAPAFCPICQTALKPLTKSDITKAKDRLDSEFDLADGSAAFAGQLRHGLLMIAGRCSCLKDKINPSLVNRGRVAAKLLGSFQMALTEGIRGGQLAVELSMLRQINHLVLSLFQGEDGALASTLDLILSAAIIMLDGTGSWLEFTDPELPDLMVKGDESKVEAARKYPAMGNSVTTDIASNTFRGKLGVVLPRDMAQAVRLIPLMAQECIITIEIYKLFGLLNKQLNQVLGSVASAVFLIDKHFNITFVNRQAEKLFQIPAIELLGSSISLRQGPWVSYLQDGIASPVRGEMEPLRIESDPDKRCFIDWQMAPLMEGSTVMGWLLLLDDRTDYYRWQEEARKAERFAATATMVGALAHELRNPIGAARGLLQLMERKQDPEQNRNYSDLVIRELDRVTRLLNEFLLLGQPANIEARPIDPAVFLRELFPLFQGEVEARDIEIVLDIRSRGSTFAGDPGQLTQVMLNLVRNAVQAVEHSGRVAIILKEYAGFVCIDVEDNGPGLAPDVQNNLFRPFFTTKERGTGLGLPVVQAIVHNHGGNITAINKSEGGAKFTLSFPTAIPDRTKKIDILIIARDNLFVYPAEKVLTCAGYNVKKFANFEQAANLAREDYPAAIIADAFDNRKYKEKIALCRLYWPKAKVFLLISPLQECKKQDLFLGEEKEKGFQPINYFEYPVDLTQVVSSISRILRR